MGRWSGRDARAKGLGMSPGWVGLSHRIYLYRVRRHQQLSERGVRWGQSSCGCEFPFGGRHQQPALPPPGYSLDVLPMSPVCMNLMCV